MLRFIKKFIIVSIVLISSLSNANDLKGLKIKNSNFDFQTPLKMEDAFVLEVLNKKDYVTIFFEIKPKHYLYSEQLIIKVNGILYKDYKINNSIKKFDEYYGETSVVYDTLYLKIPIQNIESLNIRYQGCSEKFNICYPPNTSSFSYNLNKKVVANKENISLFDLDSLSEGLLKGSLLFNIFVFFIAGFLVSLTPCVLPMIPIISAIVVSQTDITSRKAFKLSLSYVIGTSIAYSLIGVIVAFTSINLQIQMQSPYFLIFSFVLLMLLSLSMADLISIGTPSKINTIVSEKINKIAKNGVMGSLIIGFLSALIISPCIAAPLVAATLYVSATGDWIIGGVNLFSFGMGSGLILIIFATSLNKVKIKSGNFMNEIKYFFSYMLAITGVYILERVAGDIIMYLLMFSITSIYIKEFYYRNKNIKRLILSVLLFSLLMLFANNNMGYIVKDINGYKQISNELDYNNAIIDGEKVIIKVTADWCTYCKKMEIESFSSNKDIKEKLKEYSIYNIELTETDHDERVLLKKIGVVAPPALIIINNGKKTIKIGYMESEDILREIM